MTQVSKYPLPKALEEQMFNLFWKALADLRMPMAEFLSSTQGAFWQRVSCFFSDVKF